MDSLLALCTGNSRSKIRVSLIKALILTKQTVNPETKKLLAPEIIGLYNNRVNIMNEKYYDNGKSSFLCRCLIFAEAATHPPKTIKIGSTLFTTT